MTGVTPESVAPEESATDHGFDWFAPMVLWPVARSLLPDHAVRAQGGGRPRINDAPIFAAVVFVLVSGCVWRDVAKVFGVSWQTVHRRFGEWTSHGLWNAIVVECASDVVGAELQQWAQVVADLASERAGTNRDNATGGARPMVGPDTNAPDRARPRVTRQLNPHFAARLFGSRPGPQSTGNAAR